MTDNGNGDRVNLFRPRQGYMASEVAIILVVLVGWGGATFGFQLLLELLADPAGGSFLHPVVPPNFEAPPLNWFRGLDLDATMNEKNLSAHAVIIMQSPAKK